MYLHCKYVGSEEKRDEMRSLATVCTHLHMPRQHARVLLETRVMHAMHLARAEELLLCLSCPWLSSRWQQRFYQARTSCGSKHSINSSSEMIKGEGKKKKNKLLLLLFIIIIINKLLENLTSLGLKLFLNETM